MIQPEPCPHCGHDRCAACGGCGTLQVCVADPLRDDPGWTYFCDVACAWSRRLELTVPELVGHYDGCEQSQLDRSSSGEQPPPSHHPAPPVEGGGTNDG